MTSEGATRGVQAIGVGAMQLWSSFIEIPRRLCRPPVRTLCFANDRDSMLDWLHVRVQSKFVALHHFTSHPCPATHVPRMCQRYSHQHRDLLFSSAWQLHAPCEYAHFIIKPSWVWHAVRRQRCNTNLAKQHRRAFPHLHSGVLGDIFKTTAVIALGSGLLRLSQASESRTRPSIWPYDKAGGLITGDSGVRRRA